MEQIDSKKNTSIEPFVSLVIITYNGGPFIADCLRSIVSSDYHNFELIIVDNASSDGSVDAIAKNFDPVQIVRLKVNVGYGAAANIGIRNAKGELVVLINQDVVVHKQWLTNLIGAYEKYGDAIYQPKILLASDVTKINTAGNNINLTGFSLLRGVGESSGLYVVDSVVCYASGACVMFPKSVFNDVGLFDPIFFMYKEDLDWGWRAIMQGYSTICVASSVVFHHWSFEQNLKMKIYFSERNRLIVLTKNYSSKTLVILFPFFLVYELITIIFCCCRGTLKPKLMAYVDYVQLLSRVRLERMNIQKKRRVSDKAVLSKFTFDLDHNYLGSLGKSVGRVLGTLGKLLCRFV